MMRCLNSRLLLLLLLMLSSLSVLHAQATDTASLTTYDSDTSNIVSDTGAVVSDSVATTSAPQTSSDTSVSFVLRNASVPADTSWQRLTAGDAFSYRTQREFTALKETPQEPSGLEKFLIALIAFFMSAFGKILLWGMLALLIGYIVYRIATGGAHGLFSRKNKVRDDGEAAVPDEEDLLGNNWEARLHAAQQAGDTRLVIRYSFMLLLQMLQQRDLIAYRQDKTNTDYYRELADNPVRAPYRALLRQYEQTWYGNYLPTGTAFEAYLQTFEGVKKQLRR